MSNAFTPIDLRAGSGELRIFPHGAHIASYSTRAIDGQLQPVLFLSSRSFYEQSKPIRGGIPIVFPWFGPRDGDKSQMHGVVRTRTWNVASRDDQRIVMTFASNAETRAIWPNDFELTLTATCGDALTVELTTKNSSSHPFTFENALHTYYLVGDVRQAKLFGLTGATFVDRAVSDDSQIDQANPLTFARLLDRVYTNTSSNCVIEDPVLRRKIFIEKTNSQTTVVWNPWQELIKTMPDMAPDEWTKFICVETANAKANAISLASGESHTMTLRIWASGL